MSDVLRTVDHIGGLEINVYRSSSPPSSPVALLFLLHGRHGSTNSVDPIAEHLVKKSIEDQSKKALWVLTFDHRNHGSRLVKELANQAWRENPENNERHAVDMYSIQTGTARDVSFLIDFLPAYFLPAGPNKIEQWGMAGISLGGHSTWLTLSQDPRVTVGIPIIGCPHYLSLITHRASINDIPVSFPYFPPSLLDLIKASDPASTPYSSLEPSNPFLGKKILVLSGEDDTLVPWSANEDFIRDLQVGETGIKKVQLYKGVGHQCTPEMIQELYNFVSVTMLENTPSHVS